MKTNVTILETTEGKVVAKFLIAYSDEDDWGNEYQMKYYQSITGEIWRSVAGDIAEKCNPGLGIEPRKERRHGGHCRRKMDRQYRVGIMTDFFRGQGDLFGQNRRLRRRMWPSPAQLREADETLPF